MITIHDIAPHFSLSDQSDRTHRLSDYLGQWVILYFYPKDSTPGCTKEACSFRDQFVEFEKRGVKVFGISKDSIGSHKKFADRYTLPFPLLSDSDGSVATSYGAWGKKKFMGREYEGMKRISFLIGPKGTVEKMYEKVDPVIHAKEILSDIDAIHDLSK